MALAAANHARYGTLRRVFGVEREQANLLTFVLLATAGPPTAAAVWRAVRAPLAVATGLNAAVGAVALRAATGGLAGPSAREVPHYEALLMLAVAGGFALPQVRRASRGLRETERRVRQRRERMYGTARTAMRRERPGASA
jgi:hypothetical protein